MSGEEKVVLPWTLTLILRNNGQQTY